MTLSEAGEGVSVARVSDTVAPPDTDAAPEVHRIGIRMPNPLYVAIANQAERNLRSFNLEVVAILSGLSDVPKPTTDR